MGFLKSGKKGNKRQGSRDKSEKRSWFSRNKSGSGQSTQVEYYENGYNPDTHLQPSFTKVSGKNRTQGAFSTAPATLNNTKSIEKSIIETERAVQLEIQRLEAKERKNIKLRSRNGTLLFEGMRNNDDDLDDQSIEEIGEFEDRLNSSYSTDFVDAPSYDPVKSGFYSKKKKYYYDSDEDNETLPATSPSSADGSLWNLMGGLLSSPSAADETRKSNGGGSYKNGR